MWDAYVFEAGRSRVVKDEAVEVVMSVVFLLARRFDHQCRC